jgi:hypothetical protein
MPNSVLATSDNLSSVAKCVFQLVTRGQFFIDEDNTIVSNDSRKTFDEFKEKSGLPKESLNLLLSALDQDPSKRPTREAILDHCNSVPHVMENAYDQRIPGGLRPEEHTVYEQICGLADKRKHTPGQVTQIVVITDINKDVDDLVAMVLLKELHRLGLVELKGFVANLRPARLRALAGRGALDALGLPDIPIAVGTEAEVMEPGKDRKIHEYEFDRCHFMAHEDSKLEDGQALLRRLCIEARDAHKNSGKEKLTFLLLSGLRDINDFVKNEDDSQLFKDSVERIILQGGYRVEKKPDGTEDLIAAEDAANNSFDMAAAREFHHYMAAQKITSTSYTKIAAFATFIPEQLLIDLDDTGHPVGKYLHKAQVLMDVAFYEDSCSNDPGKRFRPFMDQKWYLQNKSSYYDTEHPDNEPLPVGREVEKYFNKLVAYDALAALHAGGDDILDMLNISRPVVGEKSIHRVLGTPEVKEVPGKVAHKPADPGINGKPMAQAIRALVRGSLLACRQGLPSTPSQDS